MKFSNINSKDVIFSLDIGTRSIIGTVGIVREKKFSVLSECYVEHEERAMIDGQIHDITLVANAVNHVKKELEKDLGFSLSSVAIAAAGRFLRTTTVKVELENDSNKEISREAIRSLEMTSVKKAESDINKQTHGMLYCVGYSVKSYFLNGFVISNLLSHKGESVGVEIIATFLPRSVVDSLYAVMAKVGLEVVSLTLEPIAAIEAAIPQNLRLLNLALVDIGAGTSDIAISSKDSITAYGMVPVAGDEVTEAIAQALLVDFNTAERIKREGCAKNTVTYTDVLGIENEIIYDEIIKIINPVVNKIGDEIAKGIVELNGGKAPNAVFLVGGGAHTPGLKEIIADKLNLQQQRVAIKGREAVTDCICLDNDLGSVGVTVLGIALVSIRRLGHDFIEVSLNGDLISLFNSHKHTVMDVLVQGGINPKLLIGRNGRNIKFTINGVKRIAFGTLAINAEITINGFAATIDSEIKEGDTISVKFAQDGKEAVSKIFEYLSEGQSISFYYNNSIYNLEPICFINGEKGRLDTIIKENDDIKILYPSTLEDFFKYYLNGVDEELEFYLGDKGISNDYSIVEGDRILSNRKIEVIEEEINEPKIEKVIDKIKDSIENKIEVIANGSTIALTGKDKYIFIDIFNHLKFDLTKPRGVIILKLNGLKAGYYDELKSGDKIDIYWE